MKLSPDFLIKNGKKQSAVLPYIVIPSFLVGVRELRGADRGTQS